MNGHQAQQIANLLNKRNALSRHYTSKNVLEEAESYIVEPGVDGSVLGCVQLKRVQWYQSELCHLTVDETVECQGVATKLIKNAEALALQNKSRIVQCTIRSDNARSMSRFTSLGYLKSATFQNVVTGNSVHVLQKVLSQSEESNQ
jgi:N-acetylglutamate synthase-like GNAT family acetyltransferase